MAMISWQLWDAETLGYNPEGLAVHGAGLCDVQNFTSEEEEQKSCLKGVFVPEWNILVAAHRNSHNYHVKLFGEL